ncbi:MAG: hypothetical protein LBN43_08770 [Oscillospiraceae bacterium]|jgi:hypothetical protein|nr:hypothetical protein [Oscillospiraceae bacterium]
MHKNSAGIDVSKGKCMVAVMRSFDEVVAKPYEVNTFVFVIRAVVNFMMSFSERI